MNEIINYIIMDLATLAPALRKTDRADMGIFVKYLYRKDPVDTAMRE